MEDLKGILIAQVLVIFPVMFDYFFRTNIWTNVLLFFCFIFYLYLLFKFFVIEKY